MLESWSLIVPDCALHSHPSILCVIPSSLVCLSQILDRRDDPVTPLLHQVHEMMYDHVWRLVSRDNKFISGRSLSFSFSIVLSRSLLF